MSTGQENLATFSRFPTKNDHLRKSCQGMVKFTRKKFDISTNRPRRQSCPTFGGSQTQTLEYFHCGVFPWILVADWLLPEVGQEGRRGRLVDMNLWLSSDCAWEWPWFLIELLGEIWVRLGGRKWLEESCASAPVTRANFRNFKTQQTQNFTHVVSQENYQNLWLTAICKQIYAKLWTGGIGSSV